MNPDDFEAMRAKLAARWAEFQRQRPPRVTAEEVAAFERSLAAGEYDGGEGAPGVRALIEELERGSE